MVTCRGELTLEAAAGAFLVFSAALEAFERIALVSHCAGGRTGCVLLEGELVISTTGLGVFELDLEHLKQKKFWPLVGRSGLPSSSIALHSRPSFSSLFLPVARTSALPTPDNLL